MIVSRQASAKDFQYRDVEKTFRCSQLFKLVSSSTELDLSDKVAQTTTV